MNYEQVLVIILAVALAFFLILGIAALVLFIKILRNIKHVTERAETLADSFVAVGDAIKKTAVPSAVGGMVANAIGKYVNASKSSKEDKDE